MKICHVLAKMSFHFHPILLSFISKNVYTFFLCVWYMYKVQNTKNTAMLGKGAQQNTED